MPPTAALYLRSSKDRSDVSIDAQRRELFALAHDKKLSIVAEYVDAVESAKTDQRPGFQSLLRDLKSADRPWNVLLVTDTSRLSRRRYAAQIFKHETKKRGVEILYAKVPETDPITAVILEAVFEAMDEVHSLMSREKGLAGMAENIKQGFRAGGQAPLGYRLKKVETGAIREGIAVQKSVLELSDDARQVQTFLRKRATGVPRVQALRETGLRCTGASAVSMEWNALAYAGHTVWNRHCEQGIGRKFKPRDEWMVQRDTHPALITDAEANILIEQLQNSSLAESIRKAKQGLSAYLLTGLLVDLHGVSWEGWRGLKYRIKPHDGRKGRYVDRESLEQAVIRQVLNDLRAPDLVRDLTQAARRAADALQDDPTEPLRAEVAAIGVKIGRAMDMALQLTDPTLALQKINELEARRTALQSEIRRTAKEGAQQALLRTITEEHVASVLKTLAQDLDETPVERWKTLLHSVIEKIVLDAETLQCRIHYRLTAAKADHDTSNVASPTERLDWGIKAVRTVQASVA